MCICISLSIYISIMYSHIYREREIRWCVPNVLYFGVLVIGLDVGTRDYGVHILALDIRIMGLRCQSMDMKKSYYELLCASIDYITPYLGPVGYFNQYELIRIAFLYVLVAPNPVYSVSGWPCFVALFR